MSRSWLRDAARRGMELLGTGSGLAAIGRWLAREKVTILAYHNVVPPDEAGHGDVSLHLPLPSFRRQIDHLCRTHEIVDLEALSQKTERPRPDSLHQSTNSRSSRPRAIITFDDAYRGAMELAVPALARQRIPAVVFVAPALLGSDATWWDEMAEAGILTSATRRHAMQELGGRAEHVRKWAFGGRKRPELPRSYGIATIERVRSRCSGGIRVGSHSWGHEHLPSLSEATLEANLRRTLDFLRSFGASSSSWHALPYGAGSPRVADVALSVGHCGVLGVDGGQWTPGKARFAVPRINVPASISRRGLELRVSGLKG